MSLTLIYQDWQGATPWANRTRRIAKENGLSIEALMFTTPYAKALLDKGAKTGWHGVPVITDGVKYSADIEDFINKPKKKTKKEK